MFYYLATTFRGDFSALNVFTYHTVRAGGAALTGFLLCLLIGPSVIRWLQALKAGQYIKEEHVADLHALHKSKAGTPTMGGVLIVLSTVASLALWARWSNRLLIAAVAVLFALSVVGFVDDYIKLRRKNNDGLSARAKFLGQIIVGLMLGLYLVQSPIAVSATYLSPRTVANWPALITALQEVPDSPVGEPKHRVWMRLSEPARQTILAATPGEVLDATTQRIVVDGLNKAIGDSQTFEATSLEDGRFSSEGVTLMARDGSSLNALEELRLNRLIMEAFFPEALGQTPAGLHTKVNVPGFKNWLISLGLGYAVFVMVIIIASSNAVNLTDGLDGLAIGSSIMSILAYTGIAYIISRADWSDYLFLTYVPEASELTVFGGAMLGTGLGFLWFNSHPAEVFMGDTGSLALGGAIGTLAILTKQELLLVLVGGIFVVEAASVIIQVLSFKLRGKRVFKMAPIHHHFELLGWSETKVTIRFWILALLFALMSLGTLKLR
jgi:phospho-N-acetylmuramoyl-pentapeptide-transferase